MNPILCVTEFTELTLEAARVSADLAQRWGERVVLVRSVDEREQFAFPLRSRLVQHDWRRLADESRRLRELGFEFDEKVLRGMPEDGVAQFAWNSRARLIVVGSPPVRPIDRWALGCLAEEIADTSLVPVLAVRSAAPFMTWLRNDRPLRVYVGVDPAERADAVLNRLEELRAAGPCVMVAGDVAYPEVGHLRPEPPPSELRDHEFRPSDRAEDVWTGLGARHVSVSDATAASRVASVLVEAASAEQADLLVVETHPHPDHALLPHRCLAAGVLRRAPMNVLCVPAPDIEPPRNVSHEQPRARESAAFAAGLTGQQVSGGMSHDRIRS
jgi:nucleotide-binding universal stress UspA family protein